MEFIYPVLILGGLIVFLKLNGYRHTEKNLNQKEKFSIYATIIKSYFKEIDYLIEKKIDYLYKNEIDYNYDIFNTIQLVYDLRKEDFNLVFNSNNDLAISYIILMNAKHYSNFEHFSKLNKHMDLTLSLISMKNIKSKNKFEESILLNLTNYMQKKTMSL